MAILLQVSVVYRRWECRRNGFLVFPTFEFLRSNGRELLSSTLDVSTYLGFLCASGTQVFWSLNLCLEAAIQVEAEIFNVG